MAGKPLNTLLPADLPENWTDGQIVVPYGPSVDLSVQHGYNYLMAAVNAAHRAVNALNDGFETISGKRTSRFTVGSSSAGWTQADCDYLCSGLDDQEPLNAACAAAGAAGGGEVLLLPGRYYLAGTVTVPASVTLRGNGAGATVLAWEEGDGPAILLSGALDGVECSAHEFGGCFVDCPSGTARISRVRFHSLTALRAVRCQGEGLELRDCTLSEGCTLLASPSGGGDGPAVFLTGNRGHFHAGLDGVKAGSVVLGNCLAGLKLLNSDGEACGSWGCLVCGNVFSGEEPLTLGKDTRYNFVTGNQLTDPVTGKQRAIADQGTDNIVRFNSGDSGGSLITCGTASLTPGVSPLPTGTVYLMYE